jgi:hypothetical protein
MAKVRSLDSQFRRGALLVGIPLFLSAFIPFNLDPLLFSWDMARRMDQFALLVPPACGLMMIAAALLPGLPRAARAILMLVFAVASVVAVAMVATGMEGESAAQLEAVGELGPRAWYALAAPTLAGLFEFLLQGKKTSKALCVLALIGWAGIVAQLFIPFGGEMPVAGLIDALDHLGGVPLPQLVMMGLAVAFILLAFLSMIFAFIRLLRAPEGMVTAPWGNGFAGFVAAGWAAIALLVMMSVQMIDAGEASGVVAAVARSFALWGLLTALPVSVAHTLLGFTSANVPVAARYSGSTAPRPSSHSAEAAPTISTSAAAIQLAGGGLPQRHEPTPQYQAPAQPQYQAPAQPQYQAPAQPQYQAPAQPQYQAPAQPQYQAPAQPQYQAPAQPQYQAPAQPQYHAPPVQAPRTAAALNLAPYPGYPGYFICPNAQCRGGVAADATVCPHCNQALG